MKRILFITVILLALTVPAVSQERTVAQADPATVHAGMKFREYKKLYDIKNYHAQPSDPYKPAGAAIASFCLPGLGQCLSGEWGRGAVIFASSALLKLGTISQVKTQQYENGELHKHYDNLFIPFLLTDITLWAWNVLDAVWVAKVKNMYGQDIRSALTNTDFKVDPYFAFAPAAGSTLMKPVTGLTVKLRF